MLRRDRLPYDVDLDVRDPMFFFCSHAGRDPLRRLFGRLAREEFVALRETRAGGRGGEDRRQARFREGPG